SFSVEATGSWPLSFQWRKGAASISGATLSQYVIANALNSYEGAYTCYVWNMAGSVTSNAATLTVNDPPQITSHPQSLTVNPSASASFSVEATGSWPLSFQWRKDAASISGATLSQYVIANVLNSYEGAYTCYVWNMAGSVTSNAALLTVNDPPLITAHPQSLTVTAGSSASFSVAANGTAPLSYQWKKNGTDISGATSSAYSIASAQTADSGSYACVVSNMAGSATSNGATLTVNAAAQPPVADFGGYPLSGSAPLAVQFTDYSDYRGRTPQSWAWTFGDGGTSAQQNPSRTYQSPGTYTVSLTVTTDAGSDTETKTGYVTVTEAPPPVVDFTGVPQWGVAPLTVNFTDATLTYGRTVLSRSWTFGDGGTSTQQNPSRTYQSPGKYSVSLTVTTDAGSDTLTKANYITVSDTGEGISMWIPDRSATAGKNVVIPLNMSAPGGVVLKGVQIEFYYDAAILDPATVQVQPTALTGRMSFAATVGTPGKVIVNVMGATGEIRGVGHLFDVEGRVRTNAVADACGEMGFDAVYLYDQNVSPLPVNFSDTGTLCVDDNCMVGDLNGNGAVEIGDALHALLIAVKKRDMDACSLKAGDLNGDNVIDSADAVMLQRMAAGMSINPRAVAKAGEADEMLLSVILEGQDYVMVSLENGAAPVGTNVDVPIWIDNPGGLSGFDVWISYPPELTPLEKFPGTVLSGGQIDYKAGDGMVNVSMGRKEGVAPMKAGPSTLATVRFYVNAMPAGGKAEVRIEKCALKGQYGDSFSWYTAVQKVNATIAVREGEGGDDNGCFGGTLDAAPPVTPSSGAGGILPLALLPVAIAAASRLRVFNPRRIRKS
ncbi:MAG TPA: PKD domain-containing protein, partial [Candidatus Hydrogenedentes bacterium]|nr:PKD domain-containing protein [Candidatus Hydrogenedentota bacterium]HRT63961.1 PKD domain-containing protein [Candidatus Hydrogenedentota bacterium]